MFAFHQGQPVDAFVGAQPESQIKAFVEKLAGGIGPSPVDEALEAAKAALDEGEVAAAGNLYGQVVQADPGNPEAIGGLVRCYVLNRDLDHAKQTLDLTPEEHAEHPAIVAARSALALAEQASNAGDPTELRAAVDADPTNHQARHDLAVALMGNGDNEGAIDQLLEIMKTGADWNEGAAKTQILKIFEALGPTDDLTKSGRRRPFRPPCFRDSFHRYTGVCRPTAKPFRSFRCPDCCCCPVGSCPCIFLKSAIVT